MWHFIITMNHVMCSHSSHITSCIDVLSYDYFINKGYDLHNLISQTYFYKIKNSIDILSVEKDQNMFPTSKSNFDWHCIWSPTFLDMWIMVSYAKVSAPCMPVHQGFYTSHVAYQGFYTLLYLHTKVFTPCFTLAYQGLCTFFLWHSYVYFLHKV